MESAQVTIESIKLNKGWQNVKTNQGALNVGPDKIAVFNLQEGKRYAVEFTTKDSEWGPKHYLQKATLLDLGESSNGHAQEAYKAAPVVQSNGNGKETLMAKMAAQKNATLMAQAYATLIVAAGKAKDLREDECKLWIDSYRKATYEVMLKELGA